MKEEMKLGSDTLLVNVIILILVQGLSYYAVCRFRAGHDVDYIAWLCAALAVRLFGLFGPGTEQGPNPMWPWLLIIIAVVAQAWHEGKHEPKPKTHYPILRRKLRR